MHWLQVFFTVVHAVTISSYNPSPLIRLVHCKCKSLLKQSPTSVICLLSVHIISRKLNEISAKRRHLYKKSGSPSKSMMSDFASEVAKYPKSSPKPQLSPKWGSW